MQLRTGTNISILTGLFLLALFVRVWQLGEVGLSEDEANKMLASEAYRHGEFSVNAEHPMLMKLLATGVLIASEKWNRIFPNQSIAPEAALRFPAALAGSLTVIAVYLLSRELFNPACALIAAALWSVDVNSVALTRIAKEDGMVTLFFLLGNYFLLRGKRLHFEDRSAANRSYLATAVSFGLLFASKYVIPLVWITLIYYDVFRFKTEPRWRIPSTTLWIFYGCLLATFLLLNPAVFSPRVWDYIVQHFLHERLIHSGYYMMEELYLNRTYHTFWGVPAYYYPLYLFVKTPLPLLFFCATGTIYALRRIRDERFLFICLYFFVWLLLWSIPGGKFTRYAILWMPAVVLLQTLGIYLVCTALSSFLSKRTEGKYAQRIVLALLLVVTAGYQTLLNFRYVPFNSLYVAWQGGGEKREGYYFPQDDFYDAGLREAFRFLAETAPPRATVVGTTPAAFEYYMKRFAREDLVFVSMADPSISFSADHLTYLISQEYRTYLENFHILTFARSQLQPLFVATVRGKESVVVSLLCAEPECARAPFWTARQWPENLRSLAR